MKHLPLFLLICFVFFSGRSGSQERSKEVQEPTLWIKVNAVSALVLVPQIAMEYHFKPAWSYQVDLTASFWESFKGIPLKAGILHQEIRYYTSQKPSAFYLAGNIGFTQFKIQKWNYWHSDTYQKGYSGYVGLSFGYVWNLAPGWKAEAFTGVATNQARYKSWHKITGERVDPITNGGWNKSGEILPIRTGIMLSVPLNGN